MDQEHPIVHLVQDIREANLRRLKAQESESTSGVVPQSSMSTCAQEDGHPLALRPPARRLLAPCPLPSPEELAARPERLPNAHSIQPEGPVQASREPTPDVQAEYQASSHPTSQSSSSPTTTTSEAPPPHTFVIGPTMLVDPPSGSWPTMVVDAPIGAEHLGGEPALEAACPVRLSVDRASPVTDSPTEPERFSPALDAPVSTTPDLDALHAAAPAVHEDCEAALRMQSKRHKAEIVERGRALQQLLVTGYGHHWTQLTKRETRRMTAFSEWEGMRQAELNEWEAQRKADLKKQEAALKIMIQEWEVHLEAEGRARQIAQREASEAKEAAERAIAERGALAAELQLERKGRALARIGDVSDAASATQPTDIDDRREDVNLHKDQLDLSGGLDAFASAAERIYDAARLVNHDREVTASPSPESRFSSGSDSSFSTAGPVTPRDSPLPLSRGVGGFFERFVEIGTRGTEVEWSPAELHGPGGGRPEWEALLEKREADLQTKEEARLNADQAEIAQVFASLGDLEVRLNAQELLLDNRYAKVAQRKGKMEAREARFEITETAQEHRKKGYDSLRDRLNQRETGLIRREADFDERKADVTAALELELRKSVESERARFSTWVSKRTVELVAFRGDLDKRSQDLNKRSQDLDELKRSLDERGARYIDLEVARSDEHDRLMAELNAVKGGHDERDKELDARTAKLADQEGKLTAEHATRIAELDQRDHRLVERQDDLDRRQADISEQERKHVASGLELKKREAGVLARDKALARREDKLSKAEGKYTTRMEELEQGQKVLQDGQDDLNKDKARSHMFEEYRRAQYRAHRDKLDEFEDDLIVRETIVEDRELDVAAEEEALTAAHKSSMDEVDQRSRDLEERSKVYDDRQLAFYTWEQERAQEKREEEVAALRRNLDRGIADLTAREALQQTEHDARMADIAKRDKDHLAREKRLTERETALAVMEANHESEHAARMPGLEEEVAALRRDLERQSASLTEQEERNQTEHDAWLVDQAKRDKDRDDDHVARQERLAESEAALAAWKVQHELEHATRMAALDEEAATLRRNLEIHTATLAAREERHQTDHDARMVKLAERGKDLLDRQHRLAGDEAALAARVEHHELEHATRMAGLEEDTCALHARQEECRTREAALHANLSDKKRRGTEEQAVCLTQGGRNSDRRVRRKLRELDEGGDAATVPEAVPHGRKAKRMLPPDNLDSSAASSSSSSHNINPRPSLGPALPFADTRRLSAALEAPLPPATPVQLTFTSPRSLAARVLSNPIIFDEIVQHVHDPRTLGIALSCRAVSRHFRDAVDARLFRHAALLHDGEHGVLTTPDAACLRLPLRRSSTMPLRHVRVLDCHYVGPQADDLPTGEALLRHHAFRRPVERLIKQLKKQLAGAGARLEVFRREAALAHSLRWPRAERVVLSGDGDEGPVSVPNGADLIFFPDTLAAALRPLSQLQQQDEWVTVVLGTSHLSPETLGQALSFLSEGTERRLRIVLEDSTVRERNEVGSNSSAFTLDQTVIVEDGSHGVLSREALCPVKIVNVDDADAIISSRRERIRHYLGTQSAAGDEATVEAVSRLGVILGHEWQRLDISEWDAVVRTPLPRIALSR